eukprot:1004536-Pleurochrysis_carterae.AAC.1
MSRRRVSCALRRHGGAFDQRQPSLATISFNDPLYFFEEGGRMRRKIHFISSTIHPFRYLREEEPSTDCVAYVTTSPRFNSVQPQRSRLCSRVDAHAFCRRM